MALDPTQYSATIKARAGKTQPDLINSVALKILPKDTAIAEGWTCYFDGSACRVGHNAARMVKNDKCTDCWRVSQKREPIYPKSKDRAYYKERKPTAATAGGTTVIANPAQLEPTKVEQAAIAALADTRDVATAAASVGWSKGQFESRVSSSPVFKAAVMETCSRLDIPWKREPDQSGFEWTAEIEQTFSRRYIDTGLIEQVRTEFGIPASDFHDRLQKSPRFNALIEAAHPFAQITLRERALKSAEAGNDKLYKALADQIEDTALSNMGVPELNREIQRLVRRFADQGLIDTRMRHRVTGELIHLKDYEDIGPASGDNSDLVSP